VSIDGNWEEGREVEPESTLGNAKHGGYWAEGRI
jgi:hypothetical protein